MAIAKWIGGFLGWILTGSVLGGLAGFCIGSMIDSASEEPSDNGSDGFSGYNRHSGDSKQSTDDYHYSNSNSQYSNGFAESNTRCGNRNSFLFSMLVLASYIIKADGRIMHSEMEFVRQFLRQNFGEEAAFQGNGILMKLFERQKRYSPSQIKETIRQACVEMNMHMDYSTRLQLINFLVLIARADGTVSTEEVAAIREIGIYLNLSREDVESMLHLDNGSSSEGSLDDAYKVLGVSPDASDKEVRDAYRRMALKHHPDRVAALGDDVRKAAEKKFQEINAAKERIWKARGL